MTDVVKWKLGLPVLLALAAVTRFWHLGELPYVVFDEVYNATMAVQYLAGRPFVDVHPPVARLHFAAAAYLAGAQPSARFDQPGLPYGDFPYRALRKVSAVAGVLLVWFIILLTKEITGSRPAALMAGWLVVFDNALTLYSRLILPDIFLLLYGTAGLWCYFRHERYLYRSRAWYGWLIGAGVFFALSAGVKVTGWIFPGLAFLHYLIQRASQNHKRVSQNPSLPPLIRGESVINPIVVWLFVMPGVVILFFTLFHFLLLDSNGPVYIVTSDRPFSAFTYLREHNPLLRWGKLPAIIWQRAGETALATVAQADTSYTGGTATASTPWLWPFMQRPMIFLIGQQEDGWRMIYFMGNPLIWWGGLAALVWWLRQSWRERKLDMSLAVIALGYAAYMAGMLLIGRPLYLYNYLTALFFLLIVLAHQMAVWQKSHPYAVYAYLIAIVMAFLYFAPYTYGLPVSLEQVNARAAFVPWLNPLAGPEMWGQ